MKLLITGLPKSGKTTLIKNFCLENKDRCIGFYTEEIKEKGKRVGFKLCSLWGENFIFAHINFSSLYRVSEYYVDIKVLDKVIFELKDRVQKNKIIIIDEIGKMELFSKVFRNFIEDVFYNLENPTLATIALRSSDPLILRLKKDFLLFELKRENRDFLFQKIKNLFKQ